MELIERYLQAVGFWLPPSGKQDILAELAGDIYAQLEEREQAAGHSLPEAEVSALLKARGRPMFVANAYQPKRYLIGPLLFPAYSFVLKIVAACYLAPTLLVWLLLAVSPGWRATHGATSWAGAFALAVAHIWATALAALAVVTVGFAMLERTDAASRVLKNWDPGKLPRVRVPNQLSRSSATVECAIMVALVIWWLARMAPLRVFHEAGLQVWFTPAWHSFFWALAVVWLGSAGLALVNALRPYWTPERATCRLLVDAASAALLCWLSQANIVSGVVVPAYTTGRCLALKNALNLWAGRSLPILIIVGVVLVTIDGFRVVRVARSGGGSYRKLSLEKPRYS